MDTNGKFFRTVLNCRRQAIADSETSSAGERELKKSPSQQSCTCCACHPEKQELKRKTSSFTDQTDGLRKGSYKDQLETKVLNEEMNEKLSFDSHNSSKKQVEDLSSLIKEFSSYSRSLDIRFRAAERLQKILKEIVLDQNTSSLSRRSSSEVNIHSKIKEVQKVCEDNSELPPNYFKKCNEFSEKYKEHSEATANFSYFLQNEKLSNSEMRRLDIEYDNLRKEFNDSKTSVSSQLSDIISRKSEVVSSCVDSVLQLLEDMMDQDKDIYNLLNSLLSYEDMQDGVNSKINKERCRRRKSQCRTICRRSKSRCCFENNECES